MKRTRLPGLALLRSRKIPPDVGRESTAVTDEGTYQLVRIAPIERWCKLHKPEISFVTPHVGKLVRVLIVKAEGPNCACFCSWHHMHDLDAEMLAGTTLGLTDCQIVVE